MGLAIGFGAASFSNIFMCLLQSSGPFKAARNLASSLLLRIRQFSAGKSFRAILTYTRLMLEHQMPMLILFCHLNGSERSTLLMASIYQIGLPSIYSS